MLNKPSVALQKCRRKKNPAPGRISAHNLLVINSFLYGGAVTTDRALNLHIKTLKTG